MRKINLTPRAQELINSTALIAIRFNTQEITLEHILLGFLQIAKKEGNQIYDAFVISKINPEIIYSEICSILDLKKSQTEISSKKTYLDKSCKDLLVVAKSLADANSHEYVGLEHIFISLFESKNENIIKFCKQFKLKLIYDILSKGLTQDIFALPEGEVEEEQANKGQSMLDNNSVCLNDQILSNKINRLHINQCLIDKLSEILCRKNKNNPLIIGEAGVGKTALVEGLAQCIVEGKCSDFLAFKRIYALDVAGIISGCKYRGEFEKKIKQILSEAINDPSVILFIDEIHMIIGAGNAENGMDIANILKPYLARGDISCIGATTFDEYRKTISSDPALSRRFQVVKIEEPNKEETLVLLKNIIQSYEDYHGIIYPENILKFAIDISDKYLSGRFPDKVLDLIDQAGSSVKLNIFTKNEEMKKIHTKMQKIIDSHNKSPHVDNLEKLTEYAEKYKKATEKMVEKWEKNPYQISEKDLLQVVSNKTNIPIEELLKKDLDKLITIQNKLKEVVFGQDEAIEVIYKNLLRAKAGLNKNDKPTLSLILSGSSGTGKTFLAENLANYLSLNRNDFVKIDMAEYADSTSLNKLVGTSAGYIGFDKGGILTERIKKNANAIILFDNIDQAHTSVLSSISQILSEGKLTDSYGSIIDFSNCIILMTTRFEKYRSSNLGFSGSNDADDQKNIKDFFGESFLSKIDDIIFLNKLQETNYKEIIAQELDKFCISGCEITYTDKVVEYILNKTYSLGLGVRNLQKFIQKQVGTLIAENILINSRGPIKLDISNNELMCNNVS